jgi:hypothetical protein
VLNAWYLSWAWLFLVNIIAGASKKMRVSNDEVLYELLQENGRRDISESIYGSDNEINMNILSCGEHTVSSDGRKCQWQQ